MHLVDTTLFFSPTSGGIKSYLTAKHAWLANAGLGWQHSILVPGPGNSLQPGGISTVYGPRVPGSFNYRLPLSLGAWSRMLNQLQPDIIEAGDMFHGARCTLRVARQRKVPAVAFFHSNLAQLLGSRFGAGVESAVAHYVQRLYPRFDVVLAPSQVMCDYLAQLGIGNVALQPLGVDVATFNPDRRLPGLRHELGLTEDTRLLIYAGRFSSEKNLPVLHQAMALLGRPYHLLLIGGARAARPSYNISIYPYRADKLALAAWLASADALVHAGGSETFGLIVLEAMACGLPVVGVRGGAVPELVDGTVGELAPVNDAAGLANAIRRLFERDLTAAGSAARQKVMQSYTWEQTLRRQMQTYQRLVGQKLPQLSLRTQTA